jgi:hypothetical protein
MTAQFESRFDVAYDGELPDSVDEAALRRMEAVAAALDDSITIPGTDIGVGLDPILGVLPVAGDIVSAGISLYIVAESANLGVSYTTLLRMLGNITVDLGVGSIPVVGDIFDALWRANVRNVELALRDLSDPPATLADSTPVEDEGANETEGVEIPVGTEQ